MTSWFTSDLHLGHRNISRYCRRPFAYDEEGVHEMNQALIEAWNTHVGVDDTVWVLGDVAMGRVDESLRLVKRMQGRKYLVPGNHDRCWPGRRELDWVNWQSAYADVGLTQVRPGELDLCDGTEVWIDHFQYEPTKPEAAADKFAAYRPEDRGGWLLHGHVHERWRQKGREINVGVDAWGGRPVSEGEIVKLIEAGPRDLNPLVWA